MSRLARRPGQVTVNKLLVYQPVWHGKIDAYQGAAGQQFLEQHPYTTTAKSELVLLLVSAAKHSQNPLPQEQPAGVNLVFSAPFVPKLPASCIVLLVLALPRLRVVDVKHSLVAICVLGRNLQAL
jgi:hypothetical protein